MAKYCLLLLTFFTGLLQIISPAVSFAQINTDSKLYFDPQKRFSLKAFGTYISSTELQNDINSQNPIERDASLEMDGGFGYGAELTFDPRLGNTGIRFFISSEYFSHRQSDLYFRIGQDTSFFTVRFEERFYFIPLEAGIKWDLPISGENFKINIGGGAGIYFGNRTRFMAGGESVTNKIKPGYSLNIASGIEYYIARNLSTAFEFKFREAYFEVESQFGSGRNPIYGLPNPFNSRIVVNGTVLTLGLKYNF